MRTTSFKTKKVSILPTQCMYACIVFVTVISGSSYTQYVLVFDYYVTGTEFLCVEMDQLNA
jgi:hypothetical protein